MKGDGAELGVAAPLGGPNGPAFGEELTGGANGDGLTGGASNGPGAAAAGGGPDLVGGAWLKKSLLGGAELNRFDAGDGALGG